MKLITSNDLDLFLNHIFTYNESLLQWFEVLGSRQRQRNVWKGTVLITPRCSQQIPALKGLTSHSPPSTLPHSALPWHRNHDASCRLLPVVDALKTRKINGDANLCFSKDARRRQLMSKDELWNSTCGRSAEQQVFRWMQGRVLSPRSRRVYIH